MLRLIGLLLLIPLLDALLLVVLGAMFSWPLIVAAVVLTALVGMLLVRAEGRHTMRKIQQKVAQGETPTDELLDGALLLVAGAFLLTPGLVTDAIGFLLVIPLTRYPIRIALKKWVVVPYADKKTGGFASGNVYIGGFPNEGMGPDGPGPGASTSGDDTVDVEFERVDDDSPSEE
ncbi:FxsA family protein [Halovenus marina]|uniref:FxsA family protein n=1 Tax=Halovenus marina TaxID=3396621 RepID=UPI003F55D42B